MPIDVLQPDSYALDRDLPRIAWTPDSTDLHLNLVSLQPGEEIGAHVNQSLDVVLTCLAGSGDIEVAAERITLQPGTVVLIPAGMNRHIVAGNNGVRYTTCHRKRGGMMPTIRRDTVSSSPDTPTPSPSGA